MRKLLVLLVGLIGLGMSLSGCVAGAFKTTLVKDKYIQNYVKTHADVKPKKIGSSDIKFYIAKITDARKGHKYMYWKKGPLAIPVAQTRLDNVTLTITNLTKKALLATGWGVTDNKAGANYLIDVRINKLGDYDIPFICLVRKADVLVTTKNKKNTIIAKKLLKKSTPVLIDGMDLKAQFKYIAGKACVYYYTLLVNFFGSKEFKNAIMRDYLSHLPSVDNATSSVDNATE